MANPEGQRGKRFNTGCNQPGWSCVGFENCDLLETGVECGKYYNDCMSQKPIVVGEVQPPKEARIKKGNVLLRIFEIIDDHLFGF